MHGLARCKHERRCPQARGRGGRVTQRCHNRNPRWETGLGSANDVTHRKCVRKILGILIKSVSRELDSEREGSTFGARWGQTNLCATGAIRVVGGGRWKRQHRKIVHLSSLCRRTFKHKGNKKFRTWTKKSQVFFVFRDSYVLCIYVMNILCTFHISGYLAMVHCWGSKDELKRRSFIYFYTGMPQSWLTSKSYICLLCANTGDCLNDWPITMADCNGWRKREREGGREERERERESRENSFFFLVRLSEDENYSSRSTQWGLYKKKDLCTNATGHYDKYLYI